jgi:hypothetical protein
MAKVTAAQKQPQRLSRIKSTAVLEANEAAQESRGQAATQDALEMEVFRRCSSKILTLL